MCTIDYKPNKNEKKTVSRILRSGSTVTEPKEICHEFNNYSSTVDADLLKILIILGVIMHIRSIALI